jgi:hypothetical protein
MKTRMPRNILSGALVVLGTLTAQAQWLPLTVDQVGPTQVGAIYNLNWAPDPTCPGCAAYDVILGDLIALRATAGNFTAATTGCLANNFVGAPPLTPLPVPTTGQGLFFLVRAQVAPNVGPCQSWNADYLVGPSRQCDSRDPEVNASANVCPCP